MNDIANEKIKQLTEMLSCGGVVFFGGAGVSTESGIPDFRSESGLFKAKREYGASPEELLSHHFFMADPSTFFRYYRENLIYSEARPGPAHIALAELEASGLLFAVVTQNIDGLHQLAGSKNVFELHGSVLKNYCMSCLKRYTLEYIMDDANAENNVPHCKSCGGIVRPEVVLYEEGLSESVMQGAIGAISTADTLIVGGTSLAVYPAAGLLNYFGGKNVVLINKTPTPYDSRADLVLHDSIGKVLGKALKPLYGNI